MIKIAIDTSAVSRKYGIRGVGFYTQRLIEAFKKIPLGDIAIKPLNLKKLNQQELKTYSMIHYPYFDPFFLTLPFKKIKPTVVTVHDLIPLKFPNHFPKGIRGWFKWQAQRLSLKGSRLIITDSEASKQDVIKIAGINKNLIHRIYLAADEQFKPMPKRELVSVSQKYHLPPNFILYVGDLNWNKNISGLIKAFAELYKKKEQICLVTAGKAFLNEDLAERMALSRLIKELKLERSVIFLGFVPTKDLAALYNSAVCYCQPSFCEGFGLPVLEAMACGCPVVCSQNSSLTEVGGKAVLFIDPARPESIARALREILTNQKLRIQLKEKGLSRSRNFSWQETARQTLAVYRKVLNEN